MVLPAVRGCWAYRARSVGGRKSHDDRLLHEMQMRAGRCLHVRYVELKVRKLAVSRNARDIDASRTGAGFPPMTAGVLHRLPARSNGLYDIDGGSDAGLYIQIGII